MRLVSRLWSVPVLLLAACGDPASAPQPPDYLLTVTKAGTGNGTVTSSPAGIACGPTCTAPFDSGTVVTLTPAPATGSVFAGWSGICTGTGTCQITMSQARSVTATFTIKQFTLTVNKAGTGGGGVASTPAGINCGATCNAPFDSATFVTLTAVAASGAVFTGWSGSGCSGTGPCQVSMDQDRTVTATFTLEFTLSVTNAGTGTGTVTSNPAGIDCGVTCSAPFVEQTVVTLTATPVAGSVFTGWSGGGCTGTAPTCLVTMTQNETVTATFILEVTLSVTRAGTGTGTVTSNPAGIDCGVSCSAAFIEQTMVTLTATPDASSAFIGWTGGGCTGTGACLITMIQDENVTATFTLEFTLTITKAGTGSGTVTSSPAGIDCGATCSAAFTEGTMVTLTATPDASSVFAGWSGGGCSGTGTCVIAMNKAESVTATFN